MVNKILKLHLVVNFSSSTLGKVLKFSYYIKYVYLQKKKKIVMWEI